MEKKELFKSILKHTLFILILIAGAILTAFISAIITSLITENVEKIVLSCLISVWVVVVAIMIIRNIKLCNKKIKTMNTDDIENLNTGKKKIKIKYIIITLIFSLCLGYVLLIQKNQIFSSLYETETVTTDVSKILYVRFIILGMLIITFIISMIIKKRNSVKKQNSSHQL